MANLNEKLASMNTKQKVTIGVFVIIIGVVIWQAMSLFGGGSVTPPPNQVAVAPMVIPKPAPVVKDQVVQVAAVDQQMQQHQAQYLEMLNQAQMLKAQQDLAEVNQKIVAAQASTVADQVKIVSLLSPSDNKNMPTSGAPPANGQPPQSPEASKADDYGVVSISQLQNKWGAVISYASSFYTIHTGDILPPDGSTIISIDRTGVVLEKDGMRRKISMVSGI